MAAPFGAESTAKGSYQATKYHNNSGYDYSYITKETRPRSVAEAATEVMHSVKLDSPDHAQLGLAVNFAAMAVMNTEAIAKAVDPEGQAKVMQQKAEETQLALSKANEALRQGETALNLSKDVGPLLTEMRELNESLNAKIAHIHKDMNERLLAIEQKPSAVCTIL